MSSIQSRRKHLLLLFLLSVLARVLTMCAGQEEDYSLDVLSRQLHKLRWEHVQPTNTREESEDSDVPLGQCQTWIGTVDIEDSRWDEDRCRPCDCDDAEGAVCARYHHCDTDFHPYVESNCDEWSSDGCCCLRASCLHDGARYAAGDWFLLTPSDPCTLCKCDPSEGLPQCLGKTCPPVDCVNATSRPGQCCASCLSGPNCGLPPWLLSEADVGNDVTPIRESTSRVVTLANDTSVLWNCTCHTGGSDARCVSMETRTAA